MCCAKLGKARKYENFNGVVKRILPEHQIELFELPAMYLSQADVADYFGLTVRQIQYWEDQGLLHPERPQSGRQRRYTRNDLVEIQFIKVMLTQHGYTVPALKEKLASLQPPYYYDATAMHWDLEEGAWMSSTDFACAELNKHKKLLIEVLANAMLEADSGIDEKKLAQILLRTVESCLRGKIAKAKRVRRKAAPRKRRANSSASEAPLFESVSAEEDAGEK